MMLKQVEARTPNEYPAFLESLGAATRTAIERALPLAWVPVDIDVEVTEAVARRFGLAEASSLVAARQREELGSPLFNTFLKTVMRIWGATPTLIVKQLPTGWKQLYSDCGTVTPLNSKPGESRMVLSGLPPVCTAARAWMASIPTAFQAVCDTVGIKSTVEGEFDEAARGIVSVVFRWK